MKTIWSVEIIDNLFKVKSYTLFKKYEDAKELEQTLTKLDKNVCILKKQIL